MEQSTIRAFQKLLPSWRFNKPNSWAEEFAISRFLKKMEVPDSRQSDERSQRCWDNWLANDESLPSNIFLPSSEWYKARTLIHEWCASWRLGPVEFSTGSEYAPTRGRNSIEAKLCNSKWTCTHDNFENFVAMCYNHKALKRAVKRRFAAYVSKNGWDLRTVNRVLWNHYSVEKKTPYCCFRAKLQCITEFVHGSRFSTVPKNNEKDRPINVEPFANILVQKRVGSAFRHVIDDVLGTELDRLPDLHKVRIRDMNIATIDLSDASDSFSIALVEFLLPKRIFKTLESCRSAMVLGPDKLFHITKKISSMGNGFTFELMTLILTALCRTIDKGATVFGDDIIIDRAQAPLLYRLLSEVGLKVNIDKSFSDGPFRESCGGNYHSEFGYIRSFDFTYPESIHDCVVAYNKVHALAKNESYGNFQKLEVALRRTIPPALRGVWTTYDSNELRGPVTGSSSFLSGYFKCPIETKGGISALKLKGTEWLRDNQHVGITRTFYSYKFKEQLRSPCRRHLPSHLWAKYEMYLHSNRVTKDVISGEGEWVRKLMCLVDDCVVVEATHITKHVKLTD